MVIVFKLRGYDILLALPVESMIMQWCSSKTTVSCVCSGVRGPPPVFRNETTHCTVYRLRSANCSTRSTMVVPFLIMFLPFLSFLCLRLLL